MAQDIAAAISLYGETFEWSGADYPCVRRDEPSSLDLESDGGGYVKRLRYYLTVAKSAFTESVFPQNGDLVNGDTAQIKHIDGGDDESALQLILTIGSVDE